MQRYAAIWRQRHGVFSLNLATTRGCPFHCNWCAKPIWGQAYHSRSPQHVVAEMADVVERYGVEHIDFADDIMGLQPGWVNRFADCLAEAGVRVPYKCLSRADLLLRDDEIDALRRSGCDTVWMGAESGSQNILDAMEKGTTVQQVEAATARLQEAGVRVGLFLQFGYPGETRDDIDATRRLVRRCAPDEIGISVSYPLPGTKFHERVRDQLGEQHNWVDSDDLAMLYAGPYSAAFYRQLHHVVQLEFRRDRARGVALGSSGRRHGGTLRRLRNVAVAAAHSLRLPVRTGAIAAAAAGLRAGPLPGWSISRSPRRRHPDATGLTSMSRTVVLYNPQSVFYTMPLGLLAVGSALDSDRYSVRIVDARLEADPYEALLAAADGALCVGMSVLTGAPIHDALAATRALKHRFPRLPVIWGGWHPSLFPTATLDEPSVDITVQGQGEHTFAELVERLDEGTDLAGLAGIAYRDGDVVKQNPPRALASMDDLPQPDYGLIDVLEYFGRKGKRQFDFISSTGCHFRCAFCADPFVYKRGWVALSPTQMGDLIEAHWRRYRFDDLAFQDETFFTHRDRVAEIASEFLRRPLRFTWTATMRADQGIRLTDAIFRRCVRSGMRRVLIGVESGDQATLDWMQKDITIEQVVACAELCAHHGVGAHFPFIVGFPDEGDESVARSLRLAHRLRRMSPRFETPIFYFKPYPGSPITAQAVSDGYELPTSLEGWADFDFIGSAGPWVSPELFRHVERFKFYNRFAGGRDRLLKRPLASLARWRCRHDFFALPMEKLVVERLAPTPQLS